MANAVQSLERKGKQSPCQRKLSASLKDLKANYQLYLIIAIPLIWLIIFKYIPMVGAQIAFKDFKAADGISKCFTPINSGFIIMLGFLNKYNQEDDSVTLFGTFNKLRSTILLFLLVWLLIITGWYLIGLPLGNGVYPTL